MESEYTLNKLLEIAKDAVLRAGKFLARREPGSGKIRTEHGRDIKIEADLQSERIIFKNLMKQSRFSILSEERGLVKRSQDGYLWIVDPLDGSLNYSRGIPLACVSVGLWYNDQPVLGAIYEFVRSELFYGIAGKGGWLNRRRLKPSNIEDKKKAMLCTGFPVNADFTAAGISNFMRYVRSYKKVRLFGSAALSLAYVSAGRADVYIENDIMLWDVAGGIPILLGTGGKLRLKGKHGQYVFDVHASNGKL